jgi:chromosome segregation protein
MRLTRLHLSGFKSFADGVELPFDDGITAIVGPNGCGKSNISDAVRWVLGEQRTRLLRSAKMDEIIFHGSAKRRHVNIAEVSLHIDNAEGKLPISYSEVVITRRLSRSGQSDYLLNQTPVRLKDIQDLLRGTGLGEFAGVVIEAQMIERLLSDRTEERRALFEEAAGISLFRDRQLTTERRLEKTREDLQRLDDVIGEIHTQVRSLARQRGKADRYQKFSEERFAVVMTLSRRDLALFEERESRLRTGWEDLTIKLPAARGELEATERQRENRVQERATTEAQRTEVERRLADRRIEVEKLEGDLNLAGERLKNLAARKGRAREERDQAAARAEQAERERDAAAEERKAAVAARQSVQTELDLRAAGETEAKENLARQRDSVRELENDLQLQAESQRALAGERTAVEREIEDLGSQRSEVAQRVAAAERALSDSRQRREAAQYGLDAREEAHREAAGELDRSRHNVLAAREREAAILAELRSAEESHARFSARREALENLERERAGVAPAVKKLLESKAEIGSDAVLGPLSDFLRPSHEGARLAELILAEWLHAVLVKDREAVEAVRRWHGQVKPGPLLLLPLTPGPATTVKDATGNLSLEVDEPAGPWARALLAGHEPLDQPGAAILRSNGAVFLPGEEERGGPLSRRAELQALSEKLAGAERQVEQLRKDAADAGTAHEAAERTLATASQTAESTREAFQTSKGAFDDTVRETQRAERDHAEAADALARISERLEERTARQQAVDVELGAVEGRRGRVESELGNEREMLASLEAEQETARERRVHWQVEEAQVSAREVTAREREERAETALGGARGEMSRLDRELADIEASTREFAEQQSQWSDTLAERRVEVSELEAAAGDAERRLSQAAEALTGCETELEAQRARVQQLGEELHQLELDLAEIDGKRNALVERIEAEWHKSLEELLELAPEVEGERDDLELEAQRLGDAIEAMGPVNPLAAQEYDEDKKRLDFLQEQRADLAEARESLEQALREIRETAREMFEETFGAVRENFQKVFHTLFDGGECDLIMFDGSDPLESDIEIRAAPRGKRTQRIHLLSSGERALVAISLLFSIYLAKPSPFCLLDEVDAPLDDANVQRFVRLLEEFKEDTQFIVITHNPRTMQTADDVYGVTMQDPGVSTIVGVRLGEHEAA